MRTAVVFSLTVLCLTAADHRTIVCQVSPPTADLLCDGWVPTYHGSSDRWTGLANDHSHRLSFPSPGPSRRERLARVRHWAYNIQDVETNRQYDQLTNSHFGCYVLEPVNTQTGLESYDIAGLIHDIRQRVRSFRNIEPLALAYIDIGQAEEWRWYWDSSWRIGHNQIPGFLAGNDPDGWAGNVQVAFWHPTWKDIVIDGYQGRSLVQAAIDAGFDGIYLDWVEAFDDQAVWDHARATGVPGRFTGGQDESRLSDDAIRSHLAAEMLDFIEAMRLHANSHAPAGGAGFLIVPQNATGLREVTGLTSRYDSLVDGVAVEGIWYDGDGGFDDWSDPRGHGIDTDIVTGTPGWTAEVLADCRAMHAAGIPLLTVEYAQEVGADTSARTVYDNLVTLPGQRFTALCSRRSLSQLPTTPYPRGYLPHDYLEPAPAPAGGG